MKKQEAIQHISEGLLLAVAAASAAYSAWKQGELAPWAALLAIAALGAWKGWHLHRRLRSGADLHRSEPECGPESQRALEALLTGVLPVWRQHTDSVRQQTDEAVGSLIGSLGSITDQFEDAGFSTQAGDGRSSASAQLLAECEQKLEPVIATMNDIAAGKSAMGESVNTLSTSTSALTGMAEDVARIARQTNLLAINAAIEASRAGDAGRSFSVIAAEVRRLSQDSADTASHISKRIAQITAVIEQTSKLSQQTSQRDKHEVEQTGVVIREVLGHVRGLSDESQRMLERGQVIRSNIESLMVSLQFQDRVSQVIGAIDQDMGRLQDTVDAGQPPPDARQWLDELQANYTMRDQRLSHSEAASGQPQASAATPARKVVFF